MNINLRTGLIIVTLIVFATILATISKRKLNIKYAIVWIIWAILILFLAIFPKTINKIADLLGIAIPVNALFLIMTALLYFLTFYVFIMISKHNEEIIKLTYENSLLKKEIKELKNK